MKDKSHVNKTLTTYIIFFSGTDQKCIPFQINNFKTGVEYFPEYIFHPLRIKRYFNEIRDRINKVRLISTFS